MGPTEEELGAHFFPPIPASPLDESLCPVCQALPASPEGFSLQNPGCAMLKCPFYFKIAFIPLPDFHLFLMEWFWGRIFLFECRLKSECCELCFSSAVISFVYCNCFFFFHCLVKDE